MTTTQIRFDELLPPLDDEQYRALKADIAKHGVLVPLEVDAGSGTILDGHHRAKIAAELGIECPRAERHFNTDEERVEHAIKLNLLRRQMGPVTWAETFRSLAQVRGVRLGRGKGDPSGKTATVAVLAEELGVPERTAQRRMRLAEELSTQPDLAEAVDRGDMHAKQAIREKRKREAQTRTSAKPTSAPSGRYEVIYADPPWRYDYAASSDRTIEAQYPTLELDEIKAIQPPTADDAVLFLWTTSPKLREGLEVIAAWGFEYRTCMVWVKDQIGMGYYARQQHELLLIGRRGSFPPPEPSDRPSSVIEAPRGKHSEKPQVVYELLERMYPNSSRCEMFARAKRPGWTSWGNEV